MSHESGAAAVLAFSFEVKSLVTELNAALATLFRPLGLTCVQAEAIMALDDLSPVTLKQLAAHLVAESGHPSRRVSRLVENGLVARTGPEQDGRAAVLELTLPEGEQYQAEVIDTWGMTNTPLAEPVTGRAAVPLPGNPYHALTLRRIG